jgi:hypothetical protein
MADSRHSALLRGCAVARLRGCAVARLRKFFPKFSWEGWRKFHSASFRSQAFISVKESVFHLCPSVAKNESEVVSPFARKS